MSSLIYLYCVIIHWVANYSIGFRVNNDFIIITNYYKLIIDSIKLNINNGL